MNSNEFETHNSMVFRIKVYILLSKPNIDRCFTLNIYIILCGLEKEYLQ